MSQSKKCNAMTVLLSSLWIAGYVVLTILIKTVLQRIAAALFDALPSGSGVVGLIVGAMALAPMLISVLLILSANCFTLFQLTFSLASLPGRRVGCMVYEFMKVALVFLPTVAILLLYAAKVENAPILPIALLFASIVWCLVFDILNIARFFGRRKEVRGSNAA